MPYYNFKKLREIDLNIVVTQLFNAIEIGTNIKYQTRKYLLPPNHNIGITGLKWFDNTASKGGLGALDLVIHIKSVSLLEAAKILKHFSPFSYPTNYSDNNNLPDIEPYIVPQPCEKTWNHVKNYLINSRKIPEYLINNLYNNSLLWSDKNRNCVFPRDLNTGAYLRGTIPGISYKRTLGRNGRPYVIPGDDVIIITEAPIDGISLKHYFEESTILATGGRIGFDKIEPYLIYSNKVLLAHDNDDSGDEQANLLSKMIKLKIERLRPLYGLKDWNEVLQHDNKCQ